MSDLRSRQEAALEAALRKTRESVLTPPLQLTLSEWSTKYLYLSPEASALPGRFRFERAIFQKEVFDTLSDPAYRKVVIMAASQTMKTQALLAYIGYAMHVDPAPILVVQPSIKMSKSFSKDRIDTMIRDVKQLRERVSDSKKRDGGNTSMHKLFPGGALTIATANSPSDLAARPVRYLFLDETDRYEPTAEGDPIQIAQARTTTFWNSKQVLVSSPGDEEISRIAHEYNLSDKRIFMVPCHACGEDQELQWRQVKWQDHKPHTAHYYCVGCETPWTDQQRNQNVMKGRWVKTNPNSNVAGFHISALYSSFKTIPELVEEFLASKDDPEQLKVFVNTRLAETWKNDATAVGDIQWLNRMEDYTPQTISENVLFITAGLDVQVDRLEMEVVGWGVGDESWSLEYYVIQGDPTSPTPWMQLDNILSNVYTRTDGVKMKINATCIDTGGTATQDVLNFAAKNGHRNVFPIKGMPGPKPIMHKKSRHFRKGGRFYPVGVDTAKERLYQQLKIDKPGPGYCHFPSTYGEEYFAGLTSEKYIVKYRKGHPYKIWFKKPSVRNEPLDCRVYAIAARQTITMNLDKRAEQLKAAVKKAEEVVLEQTPVEKGLAPETKTEQPQVIAPPVNVATPQTNVRPGRPPRNSGWMGGFR